MLNIWIGYDSQFSLNTTVQEASIKKYSSIQFKINYLRLPELSEILTRKRDNLQTTDSAFTRWLVPYLSNYSGWNLYMDSDMMLRDDISKLLELCDDSKAVMVAKHPVYELSDKKFNHHTQTNYDRKYWSSLILFNSNKCKDLTLDYVNNAKGLDLHQFKWLPDDMIGSLPLKWNHLVGVEDYNEKASLVHWTNGGPWFDKFKSIEFSEEWRSYEFSVADI
jgi:lipopolysaccharide biosynthesis glycosyltransferase